MTALTDLYDDAIAQGTGHRFAVRELAVRLDVDEPTIGRLLRRARADVSAPFPPRGSRSDMTAGGRPPARLSPAVTTDVGRQER